MSECRYCKEPLADTDAVYTTSYWGGLPFVCHLECKDAGFRAEVIECQTIDADCNDCRHFRRSEVVRQWLSCMENKKPSTRLVNMGVILGHCARFDKPTKAYPNKWTGRECFEHRRSAAKT